MCFVFPPVGVKPQHHPQVPKVRWQQRNEKRQVESERWGARGPVKNVEAVKAQSFGLHAIN